MLLPLSFTTGSNFLRPQILVRKRSVRSRGIFSVFHQYFTAESKKEEENASNLILSPSTEEFFFVFFFLNSGESDAKSYGCDNFPLVHQRHMLPCQHCIRVHFRLLAKRCFHISHYTRLHRSAHWRTHPTLVAERVTAHFFNSQFAGRTNCTAAEDTCLFRAVAASK